MTPSAQGLATSGGPVLFLFLDGVGLAPSGPHNPFSQVGMPRLEAVLGGPMILPPDPAGPCSGGTTDDGLTFRALDACLGVEGLPQSATGQASLFTGTNAAALAGGHMTAFPTTVLRELIAERSLLKQAADAGAHVTFANAHSARFWEMVRSGKRRLGASTLTALAAGVTIPTLDDLAEGRAVLWDLTHEIASTYLSYDLPTVAADEAGARLARLSADYDLVLFESFLTDLAGHQRIDPEWVLARVDAFIGGLLDHLPATATWVLCSDHGNLEDTSTRMHTTNPVPLLAVGPGAACFTDALAITDVSPAILSVLRGTYGSQSSA